MDSRVLCFFSISKRGDPVRFLETLDKVACVAKAYGVGDLGDGEAGAHEERFGVRELQAVALAGKGNACSFVEEAADVGAASVKAVRKLVERHTSATVVQVRNEHTELVPLGVGVLGEEKDEHMPQGGNEGGLGGQATAGGALH